jgi:hypothetical protein
VLEGITIREVDLTEGWKAVQPLLPAHYEELAKFKDIATLKPDYAAYRRQEEQGGLLVLLAHQGQELIGYSVTFRTKSAHYLEMPSFQNDVIYVTPAYRRGRAGWRLIWHTRDAVKKRWGHGLLIWHTKPETPMDYLMPRLGCEKLDHLWAERV